MKDLDAPAILRREMFKQLPAEITDVCKRLAVAKVIFATKMNKIEDLVAEINVLRSEAEVDGNEIRDLEIELNDTINKFLQAKGTM